ncbi:MAG TPA: ATP-binding protein [Steroidobacteraceae bacterium]|nr:ATP-binding protein [Steroidobacteraceae bacterium]
MSLRLKLLLLGLATLVLPWEGTRYAREMESALREGEQDSLTQVAQSIASSLQGQTHLLYRDSAAPTAMGPFDLQPLVLTSQPYLDGYPDEWPRDQAAWRHYKNGNNGNGNNGGFGILTGVFERMLYVLLDVHDDKLVFDAVGANPLDSSTLGDRIWLGFTGPDGMEHQVFISATGAGPVMARRIESGEYGQQSAVSEPRINGAWQPSPDGYRVELRVPLSMLGDRFGVLIDDRDRQGEPATSYGMLSTQDLHTQGRLVVASPELTTYLTQFLQPGLRLAVASPDGRTLAQADALGQATELGPEPGLLARLYRRFVDEPKAHRAIDATAPVYDQKHQQPIGQLRVTQTGERWLTLRDRALTRMLNITLITTIIAVVLMFVFAARLAVRLSRLRGASESALTREGLITTFPETAAPDELGDVARGFSTLLGRLNEYTGYLRTLAGKLAHEIRTPLTIVRSSLENLESEGISDGARVYLDRARQGSERLNGILLAMGAATRVEEAIASAERTRFDIVAVVGSAVGSYGNAFPQRRFITDLPAEPLEIEGAPDLIVQMLDKLVDNAVDFSPPGTGITVRLRSEPRFVVLAVENPGPPLAPWIRGRLFESLWQSRTDRDSRPHFGLGLYIVRLIAEFHGGSASAANLPGDAGASFVVRLAKP